MFITSGSELHPLYQSPAVHVIRRIQDKKVWYLYSHDLRENKSVWSRRYLLAHEFYSKHEAVKFIDTFLGTRSKDCDVFCKAEQWAI